MGVKPAYLAYLAVYSIKGKRSNPRNIINNGDNNFCRQANLLRILGMMQKSRPPWYILPDNFIKDVKKCYKIIGQNIPGGLIFASYVASILNRCTLFVGGAPVLISQPHFYQGDPYYQQQVGGLSPDKDKHETFIGVEPVSLPAYGIS